jgi:hypothetical protein
MKIFFLSLLFALIMMPISLYAQMDTITVISDYTNSTEGNLNTAISNVIVADSVNHTSKFSNTVFLLQPYGYYILTGTITTPSTRIFTLSDRRRVLRKRPLRLK